MLASLVQVGHLSSLLARNAPGVFRSRRGGFLGSAARQRLLAIVAGFDLSGAPIGNWSLSISLVRRRPAVRVRPWAPNSIAPFTCSFSSISSPQKCGALKACQGFRRSDRNAGSCLFGALALPPMREGEQVGDD